ncbi:MAG: helix-turn-helix domain-containing protein [Acidimicrobiales bacterium]
MLELFNTSPHVMVVVKDRDRRYLAVNDMFVRRLKRRNKGEVVGFTAADFFPPDLALAYDAEDHALLHTGRATHNPLEIVTDHGGRRDWFLTTRVLHYAEPGAEPIIVCVSNRAPLPASQAGTIAGLQAAIDLATKTPDRSLRVSDLAEAAGMSTDALERSMQRVLGVSPKQYIMRTRLERAASILATTSLSLTEVAAKCGYYDQSPFTRYFRDGVGMTPGDYRSAIGK